MVMLPVADFEVQAEALNVLRRLRKAYEGGSRHYSEEGARRARNEFRRQVEADRLFANEFQNAMLAASPQLRDAVMEEGPHS